MLCIDQILKNVRVRRILPFDKSDLDGFLEISHMFILSQVDLIHPNNGLQSGLKSCNSGHSRIRWTYILYFRCTRLQHWLNRD